MTSYMTSGSWCSGYTLFGIISHKGPRLSSGHYVARVKDANGTWRMFNDEEVTRTGDGSAMPMELEDAYVLFYMNSKHLRVLEVRAEGQACDLDNQTCLFLRLLYTKIAPQTD